MARTSITSETEALRRGPGQAAEMDRQAHGRRQQIRPGCPRWYGFT